MRKLIYMLISLAVLTACEKEFDISKYITPSKTYISFIPSNDYDTTYVRVQATTPITMTKTPVKTKTEFLVAKVNGQEIQLTSLGKPFGEYGADVFFTTEKFAPGDKIEIESVVNDNEKIFGDCVVPKEFPKNNVVARIEKATHGDIHLCFDITYDNDLGNEGYYGVGVLVENHSLNWNGRQLDGGEIDWKLTVDDTYTYMPYPESTGEDVISAVGQDPLIVDPSYLNMTSLPVNIHYGTGKVLTWLDVPEKQGEKGSAQIRVYYPDDYGREYKSQSYEWTDEDGTSHSIAEYVRYRRDYRYKLVYYTFSKEYYSTLKAENNRSNNDFSELGLAPATFTYTNIKNGVGVCGAYTVSESDWIDSVNK